MSSLLVTPAKLISELIITHIKLYMTMEIAYDPEAKVEEIGRAKQIICKLNTRRTLLENEIDENFWSWCQGRDLFPLSPTIKNYSSRKK